MTNEERQNLENRRIKNTADAGVEYKNGLLTTALKNAVEGIEDLLKEVREEAFGEGKPRTAAVTLQVLAQAAARHAALAMAHEAQLTALKCMQDAANAEYTGEEKA